MFYKEVIKDVISVVEELVTMISSTYIKMKMVDNF